MSRPFQYVVDVLSKNSDIKLVDALGAKMTVSVQQGDSSTRFFNGHVTRFSQVGMRGSFYRYQVVLHPWLWFLAHSSDCRIFQNKTVPEIVKKIFGKDQSQAFKQVLEKPGDDYPAREYTVQYRETDLRFVSRLLEEAGISYHFVHGPDSHTMVLTDSVAGREHQDGYATVPLRPPTEVGEIECFTTWHVAQEVRTAGYILRDFDYLNSRAPLLAQLVPGEDKNRKLLGEFYDYPGRYQTQDAGDRSVKVRLNEAQSTYETITAGGPVRGLGVGNIFMLVEAPWSDGKTEHLVVRARYELQGHSPESGGDQGHDQFNCVMTLIDSQVPFRPASRTPKPIVQGPQTAIVVGPKKDDDNPEEIWTDDLGRVLVRFHWERVGADKPNDPERADDDKDNESTPCWVRVASLWAGKQWGIQFTPRIGQEVMVEFLEGDPDRPVVTGRMYNNLNKPPYPNAKKTQSGIKSHSTKGGGPTNFNEIRFEDKKGQEELFVQAEKTHTVSVKGSRSLSVGGDESITVSGTRTTTVVKKDTVILKNEHEMTVTDLVTETFNKGHVLNVNAADQKVTITQGKTEHISNKYDLTTDLTFSLTQGGTNLTCTGNTVTLKAGDTIAISSPTQITLTVGNSSITMSPDTIEIVAPQVLVSGKTEAIVEGGGQGGGSVTVHTPGVEVVGTMIKLNG